MTVSRLTPAPHGFRPVPRTGVIYVMTEAQNQGYKPGSKDWANLGQGAPETGKLKNSPERISKIEVHEDDLEYAPIDGINELKEAVANLYNERFRKDKKSKYTKDNIAICSGGRLALTRLVSTLGRGHVGHFLPDYTAYEELLDAFHTFSAIPILRSAKHEYDFSSVDLKEEILGRGLSAVLMSNPSNPMGAVVSGENLNDWVKIAREQECTLIFDEFYSHYIYDSTEPAHSAAKYVEDVDKDPIVIFDGLTKNWRYPGFRIAWTVAPKAVIEAIASAGSFLDGGCARPMQRAALELLKLENANAESQAIKETFSIKRALMCERLNDMGIIVNPYPRGAFYCWGDLSSLPEKLQSGMSLFQAAVKKGVIIVPGVFFDINPGKKRANKESRFDHYARFSFGPSIEELNRGLDKLEKLIKL